jgi:shikimate kinase
MIFLIGFMGSGKSTVGPLLAERLGCGFLDLDTRIEAAAGCTISEIFDRQGEAAFRELEHRELAKVLEQVPENAACPGKPWGILPASRGREPFSPLAGSMPHGLPGQAAFPGVVALGGGAFAQFRNVALVERSGAVSVWLDAPAEVLLARCAAQDAGRPLAHDPRRFLELHRERLPFYARAGLRVDAAAPAERVVEEILARIGSKSEAGTQDRRPRTDKRK